MRNLEITNNTIATKIVAATFGILVGLAGIEHGFFEILQGNVKPGSFLFEAIGPAQRFWKHGTEHALTIVPNLLVTGILAMFLGLLVVLWAARFVDSKPGAAILLLLSILLFLVGGGFSPVFLAIVAAVTATRIHKPLTGWRARVPAGVRIFLAWFWPWSLIVFVLVFVVSVEIAVFGYPFVSLWGAEATLAFLWNLANVMLGLMVLTPLTALAWDPHHQDATLAPARGVGEDA